MDAGNASFIAQDKTGHHRPLLRLLCLDEIHLSLRQAMFFRSEYLQLRSELFCLLSVDNGKPEELKIPVLSMTATLNWDLLKVQYPKMMNHQVLSTHVYWPEPEAMERRQVFFHVSFDQHLLE